MVYKNEKKILNNVLSKRKLSKLIEKEINYYITNPYEPEETYQIFVDEVFLPIAKSSFNWKAKVRATKKLIRYTLYKYYAHNKGFNVQEMTNRLLDKFSELELYFASGMSVFAEDVFLYQIHYGVYAYEKLDSTDILFSILFSAFCFLLISEGFYKSEIKRNKSFLPYFTRKTTEP